MRQDGGDNDGIETDGELRRHSEAERARQEEEERALREAAREREEEERRRGEQE